MPACDACLYSRSLMKPLLLCLVAAATLLARAPDTIASRYAAADIPLTADPQAAQWKDAPAVFAENGPRGEPVPAPESSAKVP